MRSRVLILTALSLIVAAGLLGANPLEDAGYEILEMRTDAETIRIEVRDPDGHEFEIRSTDDTLSERQLGMLEAIRGTVYNIDTLDVESMNVLFDEDRADILVVPARFEYDDMDLLRYIPAGLQFSFKQVLEYDFRVRVDEYFIRFHGQYIDEELFVTRLAGAITDPIGFLESQRPEFLAQRIHELEETISVLESELGRTNEELGLTNEKLERTNEELALTNEELDRTNEELDRTKEELERTSDDLARADDALTQRLDDTDRVLDDVDRALLDLRYAVLAFNNRTLFGRVRPLERDVIDRIVEIRRNNPGMDQRDIRDVLSDEGMSASGNEVSIVLAVYYNEFD